MDMSVNHTCVQMLLVHCDRLHQFQIEALDAVPDINMIVLLPEILDGLFLILGEDSREIRKM